MTPTKPKSFWRDTFLKDWPSRLILTICTTACGVAYVKANDLIDSRIKSVMAPSLDTLSKKQDSTNQRIQQVDEKVDALISIIITAFPQVKKAADAKVKEKNDSKAVTDALSGGK